MSDMDFAPLHAELKHFAPLGRSGLLPALHAAQKIFGWLPEEVAMHVTKTLQVPLADVHGVIEFYSLFYNKPVGRRIIRVCTDQACGLKGADSILEHICQHHKIQPGQTKTDGSLTVEYAPCLGLCDHAPAALVNDEAETDISMDLNHHDMGIPTSRVFGNFRELTANCGNGRPTLLAEYGEYSAFQKALSMPPEAIVAEVTASGLVGRGGAAFPTGIKWEGARQAPGTQKYVVCHTDESEPGTFKDRALLLDDPHRVIEGMLIAGYAIGASHGYFYLRGEYPYILPVIEAALDEARQAGFIGTNIHNSGFSFEVEVRLGVLLQGLASLGTGLFCQPVLQASLRYYPDAVSRNKLGALRKLGGSWLAWSTLGICLVLLGGGALWMTRQDPGTTFAAFACTGVVLALDVWRNHENALMNAARLQKDLAIWSTIDALGRPVVGFFMAIVFGPRAVPVLVGYALAIAAGNAVFRSRTVRPREPAPVSHADPWIRDVRGGFLRYAAPLLPLAFLAWLVGIAPRYFIAGLAGAEEAGLFAAVYGLGWTPAMALGFDSFSFEQEARIIRIKKLDVKNFKKNISSSPNYLFKVK